jgi:predicted DNA-binding protein with PD1-like motif
VQSAHLTAVGGLHDARLSWYDESKKAYRVIPIDQQSEVDSLVGDIALLNGKPSVHMHCVVSFEDGTTRGGHVLGGHVSPLLEVWVTVDSTPLLKKHDEKTGLNLMDPDAKP